MIERTPLVNSAAFFASFLSICFLLTPPARGQASPSAQEEEHAPLGWADIDTLMTVGSRPDDIVAAARKRGLAGRREQAVVAAVKRGLTPTLVRRLMEIPGGPDAAADAVPRGTLVQDAQAGTTWFLPAGFEAKLEGQGGRFSYGALPSSAKLDMTWRVLDLPRRQLTSRGIDTLGKWMELRLAEIEKGEGKNWSRVGAWSLPGLGWTGHHAVYEGRVRGSGHLTFCLTWFVHRDRLISIRTRLEESELRPLHDDIVDAITLLLRNSGPDIRDLVDWKDRWISRDAERWLLVGEDGALEIWRPTRGSRRPLGPKGFRLARWSGHHQTVIGVRDESLVRCRIAEGKAAETVVREILPGIALDLRQDLFGDSGRLLLQLPGRAAKGPLLSSYRGKPGAKAFWLDEPGTADDAARTGLPIHLQGADWIPRREKGGAVIKTLPSTEQGKRGEVSIPTEHALESVSLVADRFGIVAMIVEMETDTSRLVRLLRLDEKLRGAALEFFRMRCRHDTLPPRLRVIEGGRELALLIPERGLFSLPASGGLLVERLADPKLQDVDPRP